MTGRADRTLWWIDPEDLDDSEADPTMTTALQAPEGKPPNIVASLLKDGLHSPILDLDFEARLIPSSTPGHFHLYLDGLTMDWETYAALLVAMGDAGLLGPGYVQHSLDRQMTVLRREGTFKPRKPAPVEPPDPRKPPPVEEPF